MRLSMNPILTASCCVILAVTVGCGKSHVLVPVEGTLLLDGQPLPEILITFVPEAVGKDRPIRSMGMSDKQGKFILRAESQSSGAVLGEHRVVLEDLSILSAPRTADGTVVTYPPKRFPEVYGDPLRTPLRVLVRESGEAITLTVQSNP